MHTVEEDTSGLSHAFSEPSRTSTLKVELLLGDRLALDDVTREVLLDRIGNTDFYISSTGINSVDLFEGKIGHGPSGCGVWGRLKLREVSGESQESGEAWGDYIHVSAIKDGDVFSAIKMER